MSTYAKIAYTIGRTTAYDSTIASEPKKLGIDGNPGDEDYYPGGWVFSNALDAAMFRGSAPFNAEFADNNPDPLSFSVYELELPVDWETDTYQLHEDNAMYGLRHLRNSARIVRKILS